MEKELEQLAAATGRSRSFYVKEALAAYLEDRADYLLALAALERDEPRCRSCLPIQQAVRSAEQPSA
jgi:RHH-type rel operon transcriptional repressor/antitoxin RelB